MAPPTSQRDFGRWHESLAAPELWWRSLPGTDPISLDPLCELAYPPFELPADAAHRSDNDYFDGHVLALYLVSTGRFNHPVSRRDITRAECAKLDAHLKEHGLNAAQVEHVHVHCAADVRAGDPGALSMAVTQMRAEAALVLQALFRGDNAPPVEERDSEPAQSGTWGGGGVAVFDDDDAPGHAPASMGAGGGGSAEEEEPPEDFPLLPSTQEPTHREEPRGSDWLQTAGRELPPPAPPPPPPRLAPPPPPAAAVIPSAAEPSASLSRVAAASATAARTKTQKRAAAKQRREGSRRLPLLGLPEAAVASLQLALGFSAALDRSGVSAMVEAAVGAEEEAMYVI